MQRGAVLGRLASVAGFAAVASFGATAVLAAESKRVTVPAGTIVHVHLADSAQYGPGALSSLKNAKDTPFYCEADADVVIDGRVVIAKGAPGQGTIVQSAAGDTNAMMSFANGHSGPPKLVIRFDWITGVDGLKIRLGDVTTTGGEEGGAPRANRARSDLYAADEGGRRTVQPQDRRRRRHRRPSDFRSPRRFDRPYGDEHDAAFERRRVRALMAKTISFRLITPVAVAFEGDADLVIAVGTEGEEGILPSHAPFLTALRPGILRANVTTGGEAKRLEFATSEGFLQALPDRVVVLVDAAIERGNVDVAKARADLDAATERQKQLAPQTADYARAQAEIDFANARIALGS